MNDVSQHIQGVIQNFERRFSGTGLVRPNSTSSVCARFKNQLRAVEIRIKNADGALKRVYPKEDVYKLLTRDNIEKVLGCECEQCRCGGRLRVPSAEIIAIIAAAYRLILAILLFMDHLYLIQSFIEEEYTDDRALDRPLKVEELDNLANNASQKLGLIHWHDQQFAKDFHYERQYEFLLPNVRTANNGNRATFPVIVTLPLDLECKIGSGGYGEVYKAKFLDGYHDFKTHVSLPSHRPYVPNTPAQDLESATIFGALILLAD